MADRLLVSAGDTRMLEVVLAGPAGQMPLVFHHGTPGAAVLLDRLVDAAAHADLRVVSYARPGYGGSTRHPGRAVVDAAADVATILDTLGAPDFVTLGFSGGGPHALACAAALPGRCLAAATIGSIAPVSAGDRGGAQEHSAAGLDWTAGMGPENIEEFAHAHAGPTALEPYLDAQRGDLAGIDSATVVAALGGLVSDVDKAALTGTVGDWLAATMRAAVANGIDGWLDDDLAFLRDWGFALDQIEVPVAIWQGGQDLMVPFSHGAFLAGAIPTARPHLLAEHGHLSLAVGHLPAIVADLLDVANVARN